MKAGVPAAAIVVLLLSMGAYLVYRRRNKRHARPATQSVVAWETRIQKQSGPGSLVGTVNDISMRTAVELLAMEAKPDMRPNPMAFPVREHDLESGQPEAKEGGLFTRTPSMPTRGASGRGTVGNPLSEEAVSRLGFASRSVRRSHMLAAGKSTRTAAPLPTRPAAAEEGDGDAEREVTRTPPPPPPGQLEPEEKVDDML